VTDIPGTTRDSLSEVLNLEGIPVLLTDTAGMRTSADKVEQLGVERTKQAIIDADVVVVVIDGSQPLTAEDREILISIAETHHLIALNKNDLDTFDPGTVELLNGVSPVISVSAKTGAGLKDLRTAIIDPFLTRDAHESSFVITSARHFDLLKRTVDALHSSSNLIKQHASEEIVLGGLYNALRLLGEITGETTTEDVLSQIFSTFCIGK
jgi:tRNA modification GTPase